MSVSKLKNISKKLLIVSHNLNLEGAPLFLFNLARGLKNCGHNVEILSPIDGPIKEKFQKIGFNVIVSDFTSGDFDTSRFRKKYDAIIVNTIIGYKFIKRFNLSKENIIWSLHESERDIYFNNFHDLDGALLSKVKKVVFSSKATRYIYEDLNTANNFIIINTVGDPSTIDSYIIKNSKEKIREKHGFNKTDLVVNLIGTICLRKGQLEFTEAVINILKELKDPDLKFVMVGGGRGYEYENIIRKLIKLSGFKNQILIFNETRNIFDFYFISDIFICNSYIEAFPMVTLEAMAFSLPIISTDAYGLAEQIEDEKSGLLIMAGDKEALKDKILYLIKNREIAKKLGINARKKLEEEFSYEKMIKKYDSLISEVVNNNE